MTLLNWSGFLERIEHNQSLALELAQDLLSAVDRRVDALEDAIDRKDQKLIEGAAHALRGLLSPYGPTELLAAIKVVEGNARNRNAHLEKIPDEIYRLLHRLKEEVEVEIKRMSDALSLGTIPIKTT